MGDAKLIEAGENRPDLTTGSIDNNDVKSGLFTNVILKYNSTKKNNFKLDEESLIRFFVKLFKRSEEVMIIGDNTRLQVETGKYRQVILEGRKKWFLPGL